MARPRQPGGRRSVDPRKIHLCLSIRPKIPWQCKKIPRRPPVLSAAAAARAAATATEGVAAAAWEVVPRERRVRRLLLTVQAWRASSTRATMTPPAATYSMWATRQLPLRRGGIVAVGGDAHHIQPMHQAPDEDPPHQKVRSVHPGENLRREIGGDRVSTPQGIHLHPAGVAQGARLALRRSAKHSTPRDPSRRWEPAGLGLADLGRGRSSKSRGE